MDIRSRTNAINHLWEDTGFVELTSNRARVEYVLKKLLPYEKLRNLVKTNIDLAKVKTAKSLVRVKQFKNEADLLAKKAEESKDTALWELARQAYTKAILYTPQSEPHLLAKLFARKSQAHAAKHENEAALYSISICIETVELATSKPAKLEYDILRISALKSCGRYREALAHLDRLLANQNRVILERKPTVTEADLQEMQRSIQEAIQKRGSEEEVKSVEPATEQPYFSYKLDGRCKIEDSPVVGRHFVATGDIAEKETLLEERPYCMVLAPEYMHRRCNNCYGDLKHKFYPCWYCTEAVYCDRKCARQAYDTYHRSECGIISALLAISNAQSVHVFRMITCAGGPLQAFDAQRWLLNSYSISDYLAEPSQRDRHELEKTPEEKIRAYVMSSSLISHDSAHGHAENVLQTMAGLEIATLLDLVYGYRAERPLEDFFIDLAAMLVVDLRRIVFNVFGWQVWGDDRESKLDHVSHAQCLVGSLINHSCVPNSSWEFNDHGVIQFVANRAIKAGDEITISYGTHGNQSYASRQKRLNNYFFACACDACHSDARKGTVLKCTSCSGPVPYDTVANKVPQLNGKCLLCFRRYENFDEAIGQLGGAKVALTVMQGLATVDRSGRILARAVEQMLTVAKLSLTSSEQVQRSILSCSKIIETVGAQQFEATFDLEERLELALFMQRNLTETVAIGQNGLDAAEQIIPTLQFWFERFLALIAEFSKDPMRFNAHESELWSATFAIYNSLKESFTRFSLPATDAPTTEFCTQVLAALTRSRIEANKTALEQSLDDYGHGRVLIQGQGAVEAGPAWPVPHGNA